MASTYLTRTPSSNGNLDKWTLSVWVKRSALGATQYIASAGTASLQHTVYFENTDKLVIEYYNASVGNYYKKTNSLFRDTSAWYHIVAVWDSGNSTANDRMRFYINGVRETDFGAEANPTQNLDGFWNSTSYANNIGQLSGGTSRFDGLMSHLHFIDGTVYEASTFGETDATTGEWKINTSPSVTYGTNGFFILKDGNSVTDQSGNSNNFTASGTLTNTEDCPSNVFCTMNPLRPNNISQTYSNGNNTFVRTGTGGQMNGTLGVMSGKWYYECLIDDYWQYLGWTIPSIAGQTTACSSSGSGFYGLYSNASALNTYANGTQTSQGSYTAMASGQIWGIAFDADNAKMYFSVNGVWENSSDPANQTNPAMSSIPVTDFLVPAIGQGTGSRSSTIKINFGNGYFGTTQISSEGTNASGIGKFEYDVPTGYTALSTKGLNE